MPADGVTVRDDPTHRYGRDRTIPGDLIEVSSDGRCWYFIPDLTGLDILRCWLLLGECPFCGATHVPLARVSCLADLGAHLDSKTEHGAAATAPDEFHDDPGHHLHCPYSTSPH